MSVAEHHARAPKALRCFVLTVSDSRTEETDDAGRLCQGALTAAGHAIAGYRVVRDEPTEVAALVRRVAADFGADAILVNGGTGIARRDSTYEAVSALFEKRIDGFGELFRALSFRAIGPAAMLSRASAGVVAGVAVFSMPGSPDAVRLAMGELIVPEIAHVVGELRR
ncbi:MAG: molybdenum cofactor biosynthesis protein B [Myxococcota bacterium]